MFETIVALATPPLKSALAIIRVSGRDAFSIVSKSFSKDITQVNKRTLLVGNILDKDNSVVDQVVLALYKGPKSFTGEDLVEIISHGSMLIVNQIIELLISNGARYATNGEYSSRAFLNRKIDLIQAEAINDMINATTLEAKEISLASLTGKTSNIVLPIKTKIADILSLIEVNIDYPEYEDIEVANKELIIKTIDDINIQLDSLIEDSSKALIITNGVNVAIVGKPNVGKSSLLNALLGEDKAIVTSIPGTTRDVVEGDVNLNGLILHLLDTAGIRDSQDDIETIGITKSKELIEKAELIIVLLDASEEIEDLDKEILNLTKDKKRILVYNKKDLSSNTRKDHIYISALNKDISALTTAIFSVLNLSSTSLNKPALNNARQIGLLKQAKEYLLKAKTDATNELPIDLISVSINLAYDAILEILGEKNDKDISKEIFSRFCVGK